jgi:peptidoglycan/LPS O-acetylase OafA/YrhL
MSLKDEEASLLQPVELFMEHEEEEEEEAQQHHHGKAIPSKTRLEYLDGLRGLLCLIVVIHHYRCGFQPCQIFGASAQWITDPTVCIGSEPWVLLAPLVNGTFSVAVFFVMSGTVLSNGLFTADETRWRLAVVKRYFRLLIPCAAAMVLAWALGGYTAHEEAAAYTNSKWLLELSPQRPAPTSLPFQIVFGIWQNTSTLNNAFWTMPIELFGSFVVFGLVAILKGCSSVNSKRFLAGLFFCLLVPSSTLGTSLSIELEWQRGPDDVARVSINPAYHANLLETMDALRLELQNNARPQKWWESDPPETKPISLDSPKKIDNAVLVQEVFHRSRVYDRQQLVKSTKWKTSNPFLWYAAFVGGVWITEHNLRIQRPSTPGWQAALLLAVSYLCATFPLFGLIMDSNPVWKLMKTVASTMGLGFAPFALYYIVGAVCLVQLVVSSPGAKTFLSSPMCRWFGKISFSLYLTHIPIVYTLTSHLYVVLLESGWTDASLVAFVVSFPIMVGVAAVFERAVDRPSLAASAAIGKILLGMH